MTKEEILLKIEQAIIPKEKNVGRNSMGVSESFYNPYFMVGKFLDMEKLEQLNDKELNLLIELADFAADAFY